MLDYINLQKYIVGGLIMNLLQLGDRYATLREEKGLTISQLSKEICCNPKTISFYENGSRAMPTNVVLKYSEYFNISADYLLGLTDCPQKINNNADYNCRIACDYTGLSKTEIENIIEILKDDIVKSYLLHEFLSDDLSTFDVLSMAVSSMLEENIDSDARDWLKWKAVQAFNCTIDSIAEDIQISGLQFDIKSGIHALTNKLTDLENERR